MRCSFCEKPHEGVRLLISALTRRVAICDGCVTECVRVLAERLPSHNEVLKLFQRRENLNAALERLRDGPDFGETEDS